MKNNMYSFAAILFAFMLFTNENTFITDLLGDAITPRQFTIALVFGFSGMVVALLQSYATKSKLTESENRPDKFSIKYWLRDNGRVLVTGMVVVPIAIVLLSEISQISKWSSFSLGYLSDNALEILKKRTKLQNILTGNTATTQD